MGDDPPGVAEVECDSRFTEHSEEVVLRSRPRGVLARSDLFPTSLACLRPKRLTLVEVEFSSDPLSTMRRDLAPGRPWVGGLSNSPAREPIRAPTARTQFRCVGHPAHRGVAVAHLYRTADTAPRVQRKRQPTSGNSLLCQGAEAGHRPTNCFRGADSGINDLREFDGRRAVSESRDYPWTVSTPRALMLEVPRQTSSERQSSKLVGHLSPTLLKWIRDRVDVCSTRSCPRYHVDAVRGGSRRDPGPP
jgi:hypothetical protein